MGSRKIPFVEFLLPGMLESKTEEVREEKKSFGRDLWEIAKVIIVSLAIVLPIRYFVVQPFIVRGASMEPNFEDREYLVIDELSFYFREPKRYEVIVFRYPRDPRQFFIKRVIGLPGEAVELKDGRVRVSNSEYPEGFLLEEQYLDPPGHPTRPNAEIKLKNDEYFMMGDNRDFSSDSRIWGPLKRELIVGRAAFRAWPFKKFGVLAHPNF